MGNYVARAEVDVRAPRRAVWTVLTSSGANPEILMGAEVVSEWKLGSRIVWRGEWQGRAFEDHGRVIELDDRDEPWRIVLTHFSPLSGQPDVPENYHTLHFELEETPAGTHVTLDQDNNPTVEAAQHSQQTWETMLRGVKAVAERAASKRSSA
ncbi:SRPBCC domain-containing protein [Leifsonia shinshuensis]|uniref:SRPBCC family protein n=1 Tax=Leifsonia shinshuensis TaxID=150026 RepID=UPI001F510C02|nr:SRPBCC family protein [Leifsonia shinshuensis]MCI0157858.1 SRPBCC domain-containing protein [Leifsonia shinshuensis]